MVELLTDKGTQQGPYGEERIAAAMTLWSLGEVRPIALPCASTSFLPAFRARCVFVYTTTDNSPLSLYVA